MMILSLLMLAASGLCAAAAPMAGIVANGGLDQRDGDKPVGWYLKGEGIRAEKGVGMNASGGVLWESAAPSPIQCGVGQVIELRPNTAYNYEAYVRTENFKGKAQKRLFGAYAMWSVPQAFNMASYAKDMPGCRFPTLDELRSVNWQHVAGGANGLIAYAFSLRDDFMPHWGDVCAAADEVRRMAPVLLSIEPAPQVESTSELVPCRAWVKDGDLYLLACNVVREPVEASVRIGSGNWRMAGAEVGVAAKMADGRTVAFDLPAIGVSFVRMVPQN